MKPLREIRRNKIAECVHVGIPAMYDKMLRRTRLDHKLTRLSYLLYSIPIVIVTGRLVRLHCHNRRNPRAYCTSTEQGLLCSSSYSHLHKPVVSIWACVVSVMDECEHGKSGIDGISGC